MGKHTTKHLGLALYKGGRVSQVQNNEAGRKDKERGKVPSSAAKKIKS